MQSLSLVLFLWKRDSSAVDNGNLFQELAQLVGHFENQALCCGEGAMFLFEAFKGKGHLWNFAKSINPDRN